MTSGEFENPAWNSTDRLIGTKRTAAAGGAVSLLMGETGLTAASDLLQKGRGGARQTIVDERTSVHNASRVRPMVEAIPGPFREAVFLKELQPLSTAEIAELTGLPFSTVIARVALGRWMVSEELLGSALNQATRARA